MRPFLLFVMLLPGVVAPLAAAAAPTGSVYTSLQDGDCQLVKASAEGGGWRETRCAGVGGYRLLLQAGDARQNLVLERGGVKHSLNLSGTVSAAFSGVGPRAEWRVRGGRPVSLIVRYNLTDAEDPKKLHRALVVARLGRPPCVVGVVLAGARQNERARQLADHARTLPCRQVGTPLPLP